MISPFAMGIISAFGLGMGPMVDQPAVLSTNPREVAILGKTGRYCMIVVGLLAAISTQNSIICSVSEICCGMAKSGLLRLDSIEQGHMILFFIGKGRIVKIIIKPVSEVRLSPCSAIALFIRPAS